MEQEINNEMPPNVLRAVITGPQFETNQIDIETISDEILSLYKEGIPSLMRGPEPKENDVYLMMILNSNPDFHGKYSSRGESQLANYNIMKMTSNLAKADIRELQDIQIADEQTPEKVINCMKNSLRLRELILDILEDLDESGEFLLRRVLEKYAMMKASKLREQKPDYYNYCNDIYITHSVPEFYTESLPYYEFHFEDVIFLICSIFAYFTKLHIRLEVSDPDSGKIILILHGEEETYNALAEKLEYELQLKPYAFKYNKLLKESSNNPLPGDSTVIEPEQSDEVLLRATSKWKNFQFEDLEEENPHDWPPFRAYELAKNEKFRRFEKDDIYHECDPDPEFIDNVYDQCRHCSKFRNIDKLRLLYKIVDYYIKISSLKKSQMINLIVFKRNYKCYGEKISNSEVLWKSWNIFNYKSMMKNIHLIRNYFGECLSYYFLWLLFYNKWLLFPSITGFMLAIISWTASSTLGMAEVKTLKEFKLNYYDISLIIFCVMTTIWATLFIKVWSQKEKIFAYFWGMENYERNEPNSEQFQPDSVLNFIFGIKLPSVSIVVKNLKRLTSYLVLVIMAAATVAFVYMLFRYKASKLGQGEDMKWTILIACINGVQIKTMSFIYEFLAGKLNDWENHEKNFQRENSLAIKLIIFEFVNNYTALYYIAFVKPYVNEKCQDSNCLKEIEFQLYTILLINMGFNAWEIGYPYLKHKWRLMTAKNILNTDQEQHTADNINPNLPNPNIPPVLETHSIEHELMCDSFTSLIPEYNERVIQFGFVCMFSVAAPLTPMIIMLITYVEKFVDIFKIFNLVRVDMIEGCDGIEIYNSIMKVFYFIGMLTSVAIVLFTSPHLVELVANSGELVNSNSFIVKVIIFAAIENLILIMVKFLHWNILPQWYDHLPEIKDLYEKKYYNRSKSYLPHKIEITAKRSKTMKEPEIKQTKNMS